MAEKGAGGPPRASGIEGSRGGGSRKCLGIRADGRSARLEVYIQDHRTPLLPMVNNV